MSQTSLEPQNSDTPAFWNQKILEFGSNVSQFSCNKIQISLKLVLKKDFAQKASFVFKGTSAE